jgi:hypothetical protein
MLICKIKARCCLHLSGGRKVYVSIHEIDARSLKDLFGQSGCPEMIRQYFENCSHAAANSTGFLLDNLFLARFIVLQEVLFLSEAKCSLTSRFGTPLMWSLNVMVIRHRVWPRSPDLIRHRSIRPSATVLMVVRAGLPWSPFRVGRDS